MRSRCRNCKFHDIVLSVDPALRCKGKMGVKMRHDALKVLLASSCKQAGFQVKMEQDDGLLDRRRPGDIEVKDWVVVSNWHYNTSLSKAVAIIDPTGDSHSAALRSDGVRAAAAKYEGEKCKTNVDMKNSSMPLILEAQGGFEDAAKKLERKLEKRKERECVPNMRGDSNFKPSGEINLLTAIGFELARRNVRMKLDRSPENKPLIPSERTKIYIEMARRKRNVESAEKSTGPHSGNSILNDTKTLHDASIENR